MTPGWPMAEKVKNRINGKRAKKRRQALCERQRWRCHWCGELMLPVKKPGDGNPQDLTATIDHVIPIADGGRNLLANTVAAHYRCNQARNEAWMREQAPE
jgi:5-methylcytosine-specific restriction endonuclease McrA